VRRIVLILFVGMTATEASAICPHPTPKACSAFFRSDAVFVGTVLSKGRSADKLWYRLRVSRALRGTVVRVPW
jgi:hypothetical protein